MKKELIKNMVSLIVGEALLEFIENPTSPNIVNDLREKYSEKILSAIDSLQEEPKECMYSKDNYTDEDRKVLCEGCEEKCEFNKKEEPTNENLEEFINTIKLLTSNTALLTFEYGCREGAKWQKQQDQSTIELAEDHAMLAGMEKMKEEMMKEAVDGTVFTQLEDGEIMVRSHYFKSEKFNYLDEVKLIIIK